MAVQFVIGRAGVGKTHLLRERLVAHVRPDPLDARVIYLVPKQATFNTQRAIAVDPRLGGYCGVRVAAPDDLAEVALVETGRPAGARLDATGRALLIGHLLRQESSRLEHFGRSAGRPGLAAEVDATFLEFERAGRAIGDFAATLGDAADGDFARQTLGRKMRDLALIYARYQAYLVEHRFDPYLRQLSVPDAIARWEGARDALVLVDDFYDFTVYERQIIVALAGVARETLVSLMLDPASPLVSDPNLLPADLGLFRRTEQTYRQLHFALTSAAVQVRPPLLLTRPHRWTNAGLAAASHALDARPPAPTASGGVVRFCLAADARDEVEVAAREVKRLLFQGYRLRDVCVLGRSIDGYAADVEAVFGEHDIPYFIDRRRPATHHPFVRSLQAIAQIVASRWSHDGVFDLLKAGLTDVPRDAVDLLQDYVRQHRVTAAGWASDATWNYNRRADEDEPVRLFDAADIAAVNAAATLVRSAVGPLVETADRPRPVAGRVAALNGATERLRLRDAMARRVNEAEVAGEVERREQEQQVWSAWAELCDRMHELLGDVELTAGDFYRLLQTSLETLELSIVPPTLDQVLVGSIDRTRVGEPKAVVLIGLNECDFPLCQKERPVLNDADRHRLGEMGVEVGPPTQAALLMERFLGYVAFSRASERMTLVRQRCDERGNDCQPSPFWDAVRGVFRDAEDVPPRTGLDRLTTATQAVEHLLGWARYQHGEIEASPEAALYQWVADTEATNVACVRDRAWPSLRYRNAAALAPDVAARLFASPLEASVSRFESFAACPFQHFARYGLRLQRPVSTQFTAMDLGTLYHAVLDDVVGETIRRDLDFVTALELTPEQVRDVARRLAETVADQLFLSDARGRFTLRHLERTVHKLVRSQQVYAGMGRLRPAFTELNFGDRQRLPALQLQTPRGHSVRLRGKIDRVDVHADDDAEQAVFAVVDYKLGGESLDYGYVAHGLMLQLLTYLLVLQEHGPALLERPLTPAAALYVKVLRGLKLVDHPSHAPEPDTDAFHLKERPRGVVSRAHAVLLDPQIAGGGSSSVLAYKVRQDGGFYEAGNDGVEAETFADLMTYVRRQVVALADQIIAGDVAVAPYLIGRETPCQRCDLRAVCRFDRAINRYRLLRPRNRKEALEHIRESNADDAGDHAAGGAGHGN